MERHISNIKIHYGLPVVVCINHFTFDSDAETALLKEKCKSLGVKCIVSKHWAEGGKGAEALAQEVLDIVDNQQIDFLILLFKFTYFLISY